jgi:predicted ATP-grasp superfamily ATP-dependent carboligase
MQKTVTGSEILCIGFNCRPIARKLAEAGYRPVVIDFFGDLDIRPYVAEGHYFLEEGADPKDADHFKPWALDTLDRLARARDGDKPMILPGSGFDDEPSAWQQFASQGRVLGSSPEAVARARDLGAIAALFRGSASPILVPETRQVRVDAATDPAAAAHEIKDALTFPVLAKRTRTAGGAGIELVPRASSLEQVFQRAKEGMRSTPGASVTFNVQEFVGDASARDASVLAIGERIVCKTRQIIGDAKLHAPKRFSYCGNTIPFDTEDPRIDYAIEALVVALHRDFGLKGLYGFDMVLAKGKAYLVEINPRIPGSMEPACLALGRNLIADHVNSFLAPGSLPGQYIPTCHAAKQILFAAWDFAMPPIDKLAIRGEVHDITPPGTPVSREMPVVTYMHHGPLGEAAAVDATARQDIKNVYAFLRRERP